jgi:hypothetical protein
MGAKMVSIAGLRELNFQLLENLWDADEDNNPRLGH